ncbi:hypothetical protein [Devosia limi]|nr:hypothetical protein [Devosia limi]SHF67827.1 hypothetical protein SAMN02745223_03294 [Devosia limi DSM 17137]
MPQREDVLAALGRVLGWAEMARSPQLGRFLAYIVERTLAGEGHTIKAYSIAVDVFGRPADFDPQTDPIVRVQARRLRGLLDLYYSGEGSAESVRILLPIGRYVPEFQSRGIEEPVIAPAPFALVPEPPRPGLSLNGGIVSWLVLLALTLGLGALAYSFSSFGPPAPSLQLDEIRNERPSVTVVEFQNLTGDENQLPLVAGLAIELVTDLEQFEEIDVRYGGGGGETALAANGSDFVLTGIMRLSEGVAQYSAILTEVASSTVVWSQALAVEVSDSVPARSLDSISRSLTLVLASPRGPLHSPARQWLAAQTSLAGAESLYICHLLFDIYRETGALADGERSSACFAVLPETQRQTAEARAASASLSVELSQPSASDELIAAADAELRQAIDMTPVSGFVWEQRARLLEYLGQREAARSAYGSAVQLNPANSDALAAFSRLLVLRGSVDEARPMARTTIEVSPLPPSWYHGAPALISLRDGDFLAAIGHAAIYAQVDREIGPIVAVMAGLRSGDGGVVNRYLPQVLEVATFRTHGILPELRRRISDEALLRDISTALVEAGVPVQALTQAF